MRPGFNRSILGLIVGSIAIAILYIIVRLLVGVPLDGATGATIMFAGLGGAFGWLWGAGAFSPGSDAHEGPAAVYAEHEAEHTGPSALIRGRDAGLSFLKWAMPLVKPMIRPLLIALGVTLVIVAVFLFVAANPIVPVGTRTTRITEASASIITGDKLLTFAIITFVLLGALVSFAVVLGLVFVILNRQVEIAKKMKASHIPENSPVLHLGNYLLRLGQFFVDWINDILRSFTKSFER